MNGSKASVIWYWPCRINWAWEHVCGSPSVSNQGFSMGKWRGAYRAALPPLHCTLLHIQYMQPNVSVQLSHSVMSNSLWHNELQHTRPPCPSLTPGAHPNPCPLSRWCLLAISSSVIPFSSCLQSFPASVSFQMSQFFTSGVQSIGVSASASVLPMNIQDWFP